MKKNKFALKIHGHQFIRVRVYAVVVVLLLTNGLIHSRLLYYEYGYNRGSDCKAFVNYCRIQLIK